MIRLRRLSSGSPVRLSSELGRGGEGAVFAVDGNAHLVAKIYLQAPSDLKAEKLRAMARLATSAMLKLAAWPVDVLVDERMQVRGFLMRKVSEHEDLHELYSPKSRVETFPGADFRFVVRVATNLARAFAYIHSQGHVIGDVNHGNAVVAADGTVFLIDCDSFQTRDRIKTYPCDVGVPLFTPPELQGRPFRGLRRSPNHDAFGLAVLIFHLLFQGRHPFAGRYQHGELTIEQAIAERRFAYGSSSERTGMFAPPGTLPLDSFGPHIARLFEHAFEVSAADGERPTALDWIRALVALENDLVQCESQPAHAHPSAPGTCCWCALENRTGIAFFGTRLATLPRDVVQHAEILWQGIMKIAHPGPLPEPPSKPRAFGARPGVVQTKRLFERVMTPVAIVGFISFSYVLLAARIGNRAALVSMGVLYTVLFFLIHLERVERRAKRQSMLDRANKTWMAMVARWRRECSSDSFDELLSRLHDVMLELPQLARQRQQKLEQLATLHASRSRRKFLERFRIDEIPPRHLTRSQRATLLSYGIATAADVDRKESIVPNLLSRSAAEVLLAWYRMHLRSYEGPVGTPTADEVSSVLERFDYLEGCLLKELREGTAELQKRHARILAARARLKGPLQAAYDDFRRAQVKQ
jgi:DNA-binding helix-hairpin-helix protein with protein kinase domain